MNASIGKPDEKTFDLILQVNGVMEGIQAEVDVLYAELVEAEKVVDAVRAKLAIAKPELIPFAEMRAALANTTAKGKYFPQVDDITSYVDSIING